VLEHLCPDIAAKAARDAWLFAWLPDPHADRLPEFISACRFKFSSKGFTWIKTKRSLAGKSVLMSSDDVESLLHTGPGKTTRKNSETAWIGRRGSPKILSHSVREVIVSHRREHSRKPDEFYARVEQFCPAPRFIRSRVPRRLDRLRQRSDQVRHQAGGRDPRD
jgi:N6-adenosine-specific RNA methylase IME4